ncbi:hypothetical protein BDK51DRAFT_39511 [Blyttiomyces helicus]|uniref:Uncharacterized protein n=1 Tax=Blyttiomyces helicus TaxID=388810 RepID=A0A4P9W260_9FUNG|nr:hypothetical protein BDK51DRAFT_39511 [Blyttiomyces helicus]|eukprot:RKO86214.1 hypothetical protein BDK51DRAFT_39511 [Blyttiomyces helicus]
MLFIGTHTAVREDRRDHHERRSPPSTLGPPPVANSYFEHFSERADQKIIAASKPSQMMSKAHTSYIFSSDELRRHTCANERDFEEQRVWFPVCQPGTGTQPSASDVFPTSWLSQRDDASCVSPSVSTHALPPPLRVENSIKLGVIYSRRTSERTPNKPGESLLGRRGRAPESVRLVKTELREHALGNGAGIVEIKREKTQAARRVHGARQKSTPTIAPDDVAGIAPAPERAETPRRSASTAAPMTCRPVFTSRSDARGLCSLPLVLVVAPRVL